MFKNTRSTKSLGGGYIIFKLTNFLQHTKTLRRDKNILSRLAAHLTSGLLMRMLQQTQMRRLERVDPPPEVVVVEMMQLLQNESRHSEQIFWKKT